MTCNDCHIIIEAMAMEIVDLAIKNGDCPVRYVNVYQRVCYSTCSRPKIGSESLREAVESLVGVWQSPTAVFQSKMGGLKSWTSVDHS